MAYNIINQNNKEILFVNHRGLSGDELYDSIKAVNDFILESKKQYIALVDFSDTTGSIKVNGFLQSDEAKAASKYLRTQALVGITGIKKMALRVYNTFTGADVKMFDTVDEAKEYLLSI